MFNLNPPCPACQKPLLLNHIPDEDMRVRYRYRCANSSCASAVARRGFTDITMERTLAGLQQAMINECARLVRDLEQTT
jgi:hypothetical protein